MLRITRYARENPIAARLLGLIILCSSVITLIAILLQLYSSFHDDVSTLEKRLDQVRISTLASITKSLWGFDQEQLTIQIESVLDVQDVVQVQVNWRDWNNSEQTLVSINSQFTPEQIEARHGQFLVRSYPLVYEDASTPEQELGTLIITASLTSIYDKLWERALFIASVQSAKTLLVSFFILWLIHALLTRHMETIAHYARQLHLDNLTTPLRLKRVKTDFHSDELDNVVDAINHMRETLLEDIEQRHAIELALLSEKQEKLETRRQKNAAEDASRAKSQFLATMSHEIRTPMNGVIGMLEMLRDTPLNDNQKHYIDVIHRSGETLLEIINDILDYSKIEAGKMQLEVAIFDLEDLLEDCIQLFGATASKRQIELFGGVNPGTPLLLKGDPTRLRQIIINLLGNAFKFTTEGFISLQVECVDNASTQTPLLRFAVQDSGIGIDASAYPNLFDSFNQADASTTRKYGGTGLGLAICKSLAELMGGSVGVDSTKGQGSTFWFTAQFSVADVNAIAPHHDEQLSELLNNKKLLLADTSELPAQFLARHCKSWGVDLHLADSMIETIACLKQATEAGAPFDFVALGNLSDGNALQLAQAIRAEPALLHLPLFVLSDNDIAINQQALQSLEIHRVLRKPISAKTLKLELAALLGRDIAPLVQKKQGEQNYHLFAHLHVLVAEDNAVNRMVIKGLLSKLHIEPELVENGVAAFNAVRQAAKPYDLILMDCEMPEMDGFEATRSIRELERSRNQSATPIVALTAHALQEHREAVFACGMNHYLSKPVTLDSLYATFEKTGLMKFPDKPRTL
jgi:signal transduction histidine kinase/CheY-like chemotaxis protein